MPGWAGASASKSERSLLRLLQGRALRYFLDNQGPTASSRIVRATSGATRQSGPLSISATGMGLIAVSLSSAAPYRLIERGEAIGRVRAAIETGLDRLPVDRGSSPTSSTA